MNSAELTSIEKLELLLTISPICTVKISKIGNGDRRGLIVEQPLAYVPRRTYEAHGLENVIYKAYDAEFGE